MKPKKLLEIDVQGVVSKKQHIAKKELQQRFKEFGSILERVPIKVVVTPNFDQAVDSILKEKLKVKLQYSSKRNQVVAIAKTIPYPINNSIGFILVFNSATFGNWEEGQYLDRFIHFNHEITHIIDDLKLFRFLGAGLFFSEPRKTNEIMFNLAHDIWMDYNAERFSIEILEKVVKSHNSKAIITYGLHEGYVKSFVELLITLPKLLTEEIDDFRNRRTTIDDLWGKAYLKLRELLIVASFVTAHSDALNKKNEQIEEMKKNEQYSLFFQRWKSIHKKLQLLYDSKSKDKFDDVTLTKIAAELLSLFKIYGFILSDVKNGVYVKV